LEAQDGWIDGQRDRWDATLNGAPRESRII